MADPCQCQCTSVEYEITQSAPVIELPSMADSYMALVC